MHRKGEHEKWDIEEEEECTPETGPSEIYLRGSDQGGYMEADEDMEWDTTQATQQGAPGSHGYPVGGGQTPITKEQPLQHPTEPK
jgi:hypothetical protein